MTKAIPTWQMTGQMSDAWCRDCGGNDIAGGEVFTPSEIASLLAWLPKFKNPANTWERNMASIVRKLEAERGPRTSADYQEVERGPSTSADRFQESANDGTKEEQ